LKNLQNVSASAISAAAIALLTASASAQVFGPLDPILAIDTDVSVQSNHPGGEPAGAITDQNNGTKYLNFGKEGTGAIVTPAFGSSVVQSMRMTTANDSPERDPASWELWGTNDPIVSGDNSDGLAESWTLIASGDANLPDDRQVFGPVYDFANATAYTSYKVIVPTLKNAGAANSMQVADVSLFTGAAAGGDQVLATGDPAVAVGVNRSDSNYPGGEAPRFALDGEAGTKYLNFGRANTGFIVSRNDGQSPVVDQFTMTTAGDAPERDPSSWELYGTNDEITSGDNSTGEEENWTLIDSGLVDLPTDRLTVGPTVTVDNATAYSAYKMLFPTLRNEGSANSMQIADVIFEGSGVVECDADLNNDGELDFFDLQQFLNWYSAGDIRADLAPDGVLDFFDLQAFLNLYSAGCP